MAANFLQRSRHASVFYFRRRVPDDLRILTGQTQVFRSLHTSDRCEAVLRARAVAVDSDRLFKELRSMAKKQKLFRTDFRLKFNLDESGKTSGVEVDAEPHEADAVKDVLATIIAAAAGAGETRSQVEASRNAVHSRGGSTAPTHGYGQAAPRLDEAIKAYVAAAAVKPNTARRYAPILRRVESFFGAETKLDAITQARFAEYAATINADDAADKTKTLYITTAGTFFTWCRGRYDRVPVLETKTLKPRRTTPGGKDRDAFSLEEMRTVMDAVKPLLKTEPHKFWITALGIFTGARREELAQLQINKEIAQNDGDSYWHIDITEANGGSVKTKAGWRIVPLHPALIEAGFLDYVAKLKAAGESRLFPSWRARTDPNHGGKTYGHKAGRWGGEQLQRLRKDGKIVRPKLSYFHSMRHALGNHLKQALVDERLIAAILGHEHGGITHNTYGKDYTIELLGNTLVHALPGYAGLLTVPPKEVTS